VALEKRGSARFTASKTFAAVGCRFCFIKKCHHGAALRSAPQSAAVQRPFNRFGIHWHARL
jgi:hypothetical protein